MFFSPGLGGPTAGFQAGRNTHPRGPVYLSAVDFNRERQTGHHWSGAHPDGGGKLPLREAFC